MICSYSIIIKQRENIYSHAFLFQLHKGKWHLTLGSSPKVTVENRNSVLHIKFLVKYSLPEIRVNQSYIHQIRLNLFQRLTVEVSDLVGLDTQNISPY